jgi:D-sedoheptulose 7-phosphate isomerase
MNDKSLQIIKDSINENINTNLKILNLDLLNQINDLAINVINCFKNGGKLFFAGNGGSFADSQHIATEFISRFLFNRGSLPAIALGTNSSNLSAIGNDYGFEKVFSRELDSLGSNKDIFIPITTSGNSKNIIESVKIAVDKEIKCIALTGATGGKIDGLCECIKIPSTSVPRIQETHILLGHILCEIVEAAIFKKN